MPAEESDEDQPRIDVRSYNQQGGITAYQVNIQPGDRKLAAADAQQLKEYLNGIEFKSVQVEAVMGDGEAFRLASQIKNFLVSEEFSVSGVNQAIYSEPVQGQRVAPPNEAGLVRVVIGSR